MSSQPATGLTTGEQDPIMAAVREKLSERLKTGFIELIPQEIFDKMTDMAIDEFVNGPRNKRFKMSSEYMDSNDPRNTTGKYGYVTIEVPVADYSPISDPKTLPGMIYLELVERAKKSVSEALNSDERFQDKYNVDLQQNITPILNDIIRDNAPVFMAGLVQQLVQHTLGHAINSMRNGSGYQSYVPNPVNNRN